jgi:Zn ribbon nucleic-acid-binding protein
MADTQSTDEATKDESEAFTGAIVYCPVCATNDDAEGWGENKMTCNNCGTEYIVTLVPQIVHEHSMNG